jgi:hypothetical protein
MLEWPLNFNPLLILFVLICGCGVKGDPTPKKSELRPSILKNYPDIKINEKDEKLQPTF